MPGLPAAPNISIKIKLEGFLMHPNKGQNSCSICSPGQIPLKITGPSQRLQKNFPHPEDLFPKLRSEAICLIEEQLVVPPNVFPNN